METTQKYHGRAVKGQHGGVPPLFDHFVANRGSQWNNRPGWALWFV
jgi:hypothetical protein